MGSRQCCFAGNRMDNDYVRRAFRPLRRAGAVLVTPFHPWWRSTASVAPPWTTPRDGPVVVGGVAKLGGARGGGVGNWNIPRRAVAVLAPAWTRDLGPSTCPRRHSAVYGAAARGGAGAATFHMHLAPSGWPRAEPGRGEFGGPKAAPIFMEAAMSLSRAEAGRLVAPRP